MEKLGEVTVGKGTPLEKTVDIIDFIQSNELVGQRHITILKIVDGSYIIELKSKPDSEHVHQSMWLTKESFIAIIGFASLFLHEINIEEEFAKLTRSQKVDSEMPFIASKNLVDTLKAKVCESKNKM